jgi:hypothetical protein
MLAMLLLSAATALADQCAWIPKDTAERAVKYLAPGATWVAYCEPCSDPAAVPHTVTRGATIGPTSAPDLVEVSVDGEPIDLAYVFERAKDGDTVLTNLSKLAKCPSDGVSKTIPPPPADPSRSPSPSPKAK